MRRERIRLFSLSAVLSVAAAVGSIGCLATAFGLTVAEPRLLLLLWCAAALCFGAALPGRRLRLPVMCLAAMCLGYLCYLPACRNQSVCLALTLSRVYDSAYGIGVLPAPGWLIWDPAADYPLGAWGFLVIASVSRRICGRKGGGLAITLMLLPLGLCLPVTDTVPETKYLFLLLTAAALLLLGETVRPESAAQAAQLLTAAAVPVLLAAGLVFSLFPREGYVSHAPEIREKLIALAERFADREETAPIPAAMPGIQGKTIALDSLHGQIEQGVPILDLTSDRDGIVYLRARDYARYTGLGWETAEGRKELFGGSGPALGSMILQTRVVLDVLLMPYYPMGGCVLSDGFSANSGRQQNYLAEYYAQAESPAPDPVFLALPESTSISAGEILTRIEGDLTSVDTAAEAIGDYVRSSAAYDLGTGKMPESETDFAIWFLERSDTGYCVHFATSAAVLLRSIGIPARYVSGYRVDAVTGEPVTVTSDDAHAWVEYYNYNTKTWNILEATPPTSQAPAGETPPETEPASPAPTQSTGPAAQESVPPETVPVPGKPAGSFRLGRLLLWIGSLLIILAVLEGQRILRLQLRKKRRSKGAPNLRAIQCWQEAQLLAKLVGEEPPEDLRELTEEAAYSSHVLTAVDLTAYTAYRKHCRVILEKQNPLQKLMARYVYAVR